MKKIFCYLLIAALVLGTFTGCKKQDPSPSESTGASQTENTEGKQTQSTEATNIATEDTTTQTPKYASGLYVSKSDVDMQGEQLFTAAILDTVDWDAVMNEIPATYYEAYPKSPNHDMLPNQAYLIGEPLSATLYKDGKVAELSVYDPRVVRLVNFYHNTLYYTTYATGCTGLNDEAIEENEKAGFKLVLTFPPKTGTTQTPRCTVTIYDREIIIGHNSQWPLQTRYHWLTVFGF